MDKNLVWYLAGPMRPLPDHNFPLFEKASSDLRKAGYKIISPHELGDASWTRGALMTEDLIALLMGAQGVITLPGWEISPGASAEVAVAFATEKPVFRYVTLPNDEFTVLPCYTVTSHVTREEQYQHKIPLIGLCGFAQAGKDTAASYLTGMYSFTRVAFADALRDVLYALNPIAAHNDAYRGLSDAPYKDGGPFVRVRDLVDSKGWDKAKTAKNDIRELLQRLGTEAGREIIDQNLWVRMGEEKIEKAPGPVVITDCRFPNEVNMVRRRKGTLIWVERPGNGPANAHASEHSVSQVDCDYTVTNGGSLEQLYDHLNVVLEIEGVTKWVRENDLVNGHAVSV